MRDFHVVYHLIIFSTSLFADIASSRESDDFYSGIRFYHYPHHTCRYVIHPRDEVVWIEEKALVNNYCDKDTLGGAPTCGNPNSVTEIGLALFWWNLGWSHPISSNILVLSAIS